MIDREIFYFFKYSFFMKSEFLNSYLNLNFDWWYLKSYKKSLYTVFYDGNRTDQILNKYVYLFYNKTINIIINNIEYKIYCIYFLYNNYSFKSTSEVTYSCFFTYENIKKNSLLSYNEKEYEIIYNALCERSNFLPEHERDPFFRKRLLNAISELVERNMEELDPKFLKK